MLSVLMNILPLAGGGFETKLAGVQGFTGAGVFKYQRSRAGSAHYETEVKGLAGLRCELFVSGEFVAVLPCKDGKAAAKFDSRLGDPAISLESGAKIEIRQNGQPVLEGFLG